MARATANASFGEPSPAKSGPEHDGSESLVGPGMPRRECDRSLELAPRLVVVPAVDEIQALQECVRRLPG